MKFGEFCRMKCTAPGRYIALGSGAFVSAATNDLCIGEVSHQDDGAKKFPHPSFRELIGLIPKVLDRKLKAMNPVEKGGSL